MRKRLLLFAVASLTACGIMAQDSKKGSTEFSFNAAYYFGLQKGAGGIFIFQPEYGKYFTDQFYFGAGTGITAPDNFSTVSIPLFLRTEVDFPAGKVTPYVSLQGGYDFNLESGQNFGHINPTVGVKVPVGDNTTFNIGFGYLRTIMSGGGGDHLGFNAGLNFDTSGRGLTRFLKKFDYSLELEMLTSAKGTVDDHLDTGHKLTGIYGVRFSAMAPVGIDNLYAGLSIGMGRFTEELYGNDGSDYSDSSDTGFYGNFMARCRYKTRQLAISDNVYPFAQLDMGVAAYYDFAFTVNPAVGILIDTSGGHSFEVSAGYNTVTVDESESKGSLRIAVGYTF